MPVTRSEGRAKKPVIEGGEGTPATSTGTETSAGSTETSAATSDATTTTTATTSATAATSASATTADTATAGTSAPTKASAHAVAPPPPLAAVLSQQRSDSRRDTDASTLKPAKNTGKSLKDCTQPPGSHKQPSIAKSKRILKAKEELLRLQVELAAARLAAMEQTDDEEEEEASLYSASTVNDRVDNWLQNSQTARPVLAIANEPFKHPEPPIAKPIDAPAGVRTPPRDVIENRIAAGGQTDLSALATAITQAINAAHKPKYIELPTFNGSHNEWLPFKAAFAETEKQYSVVENINRLRRNLKGKAKEAVEALLVTNATPTEIMRALESRFGRPESIAMLELETLRNLPRLLESPRDVCVFATKVSNIVATLKTLGCYNYMYNPEIAKILIDKMTHNLKYRYYDYAATQPASEPCLVKIEKFLRREAELCGPYALPESIAPVPATNKKSYKVNNVSDKPFKPKCFICEDIRHIHPTDCDKFKRMNENARWEIAKSKRLCFRCLKYRNSKHTCKSNTCAIDGCNATHHKLLHYKKVESQKQPTEAETINSAWTSASQSYLKVVPVQVTGPKGKIDTFALMDDGSTVTLVDESIVNAVGVTGPIDPLNIQTINQQRTNDASSRRVTLRVRGPNNRKQSVTARTVKQLRIAAQSVPQELVEGCRHLKDIHTQLAYRGAVPKILIGQDNWHLLIAKKTRRGSAAHPVASLTALGWVLHGSQSRTLGRQVNFISHIIEDSMEDLIKKYFEVDSLGIAPKRPTSDSEEKALKILKSTTAKIENRYETGLLWKQQNIVLPNNYDNTLKRLINIEHKIDRNPALKKKYVEQMDALIEKGYAEPAPEDSTPDRTWYLPHFAVVNPMKPDKVRVVHDAAAKTRGVSLNDVLLKGPDLLQSLPGVVMRFRQHNIALTADIKEMFMQVKLRREDRDALRYLWRRDRRDNSPPKEYRMTSLIFGATCSPSIAIYVKDLNAQRYEQSHPEAAAAIKHNHYVDDYLDSFETIEAAIKIATDVRSIHSEAGFELKQWKSNSPEVLKAMGEEEKSTDIELYSIEEKGERVLGVLWKIGSDNLTFNLNLIKIPSKEIEGKRPTKREALRLVMSLFDPLGFASPVTIRAKQLLQEVWRRGTNWDDPVEEDLGQQWEAWVTHLRNLSNITIPRQYLYYSNAACRELHVFTDASESAYSAVLYWRTVTTDGQVGVSIIIAKAKVAPLKLMSIPRLELQAAVMGVRLAETVTKEHTHAPDRRMFWTDSKTVLSWIKTGARSYKPYVAHRLAAIEETSKVSEWRWVPTKENVADDATRDVPAAFGRDHRWYLGPEFLRLPEEFWPIDEDEAAVEPTGEERTHHLVTRKLKLTEGLPDPARFSSWNRLRYATARILQFIDSCRSPRTHRVNFSRTRRNAETDSAWRGNHSKHRREKSTKATPHRLPPTAVHSFKQVTAEQLIRAEDLLMRASQEDSFSEDIAHLANGEPIEKASRLHQLSVELIDGSLRIQSRIRATQGIEQHVKHPLIIDGDHRTVRLWVQHVHRQLHHAGVEATVNECRQQYWVLRLRPVTRSLLKRCLYCRMRTQKPPQPRTGDLPECRLAHHQRPFSYTGVDYFGPLSVTVGRSHHKRYVALFTCLTTRAIHLELAASLSADSAVMAIRRFIARRGCPTEIWSDNGTNLKAADKELRQAIDAATAEEVAKRTVSWRYIPPGAPFMGGAWERMVRSVKAALSATLHERHPSEEVLNTLLAEAEFTINSRPLTHVSVSPDDPEALTPNHFLLGGPARVPQLGTLTDKDAASTSTWRAAQRLADHFWGRWVREYLPELQHRREPHGRGPAVAVGDLVQVVDPNLPRNVWVRGRVIATYPGPDNVVRAVDLRTKGGVLRRPVKKLVILPLPTDIAGPAPVRDATRSHGGSDVRDQ